MSNTTKKSICILMLFILLCQAVVCSADYTVTLYAQDGRTIEVTEESVDSWLNTGWYMEPVTTIYAPDDRILVVPKNQVEAYVNVGWYTEPVCTVYAADGRSITVAKSSLAQWEAVGWTDGNKPTTIYAPSGKTAVIKYKDLSAYKSVGWYDYPVVYIYTFDGRTAVIAGSDLKSYLAVGWLDKPANTIYNDTIRNLYNQFNQMDFRPYPSYTTYDINKDGIPELIYDDGMYEAARQFHVYTYQNGNVVFVGSHGACHGYVASYPYGNGMLLMGGHMGYETDYLISIIRGRLVSTIVNEKDINKTGGDYSQPWQIARGSYQLNMTRYGW